MVKYKDGKLEIDLHSLLDSIPKEDLEEFFESVSCNDRVIQHVTDQIIHKWTENCYSGGSCVTAGAEPLWGLDKAWRRVAKHSGEVAKREIERLEDALRQKNKEYFDLLNEYSNERRMYS
jgi:hypothetical protein